MRSGQRLCADREAEIRLVPGSNTCMVRNEHLVSGQGGPIPADLQPDTQIVIEGGIWTTLATSPTESNGNVEMVFVGDSITHFWEREDKGELIWNAYLGQS